MKRRCVFNILVRAEAIAAMAPLRAGYDMLREIGNEDEDLVVVHDALGFGGCHLAVAVPNGWEEVNSLDDLLSAGHVPSVARVIVYSCMLPCSLFHSPAVFQPQSLLAASLLIFILLSRHHHLSGCTHRVHRNHAC